MDSWMGTDADPVTLHKYLYANADGANHMDPSGYLALGMITNVNMQASVIMTTNIVARGVFSRTFVWAALRYGVQAIKKEVKTCLKEALTNSKHSKCRIDVPIVISANDFPTQFQHIKDAQEGRGNNFSGQHLPSIVRYQRGDVNRRSWPQKRITGGQSTSPNSLLGWMPSDSEMIIQLYAVDLDYDEYPFNASMESGFGNFKQGRVSGRFIPSFDNRGFGFLLGNLGKMKKRRLLYSCSFRVIAQEYDD